MSARGSISYTNDILGNRTSKTYSGVTNNFTWDVLNRMTSYTSNTNATWSYEYRADGMRTRKAGVGTGTVETLYLHDGQMPIEEATYSWSATRGNYSEIVRNGLGARGIDVMERVKTGTGAGTFYSYPVYDGHGNMIATLSKNGTGFSFGNQRAFDPWGTVRMWLSGGYAGFPSGRHSAAIGHQMDDESGLVYMRARYYESGSGRFISQDPAMHGSNWYSYCDNNPVDLADSSGQSEEPAQNWYQKFDYYARMVGYCCLPAAFMLMNVGVMAMNIFDGAGIFIAKLGAALYAFGSAAVSINWALDMWFVGPILAALWKTVDLIASSIKASDFTVASTATKRLGMLQITLAAELAALGILERTLGN